MAAPMREPAGEDLALVIGTGKGGARPPGPGMMGGEPEMGMESEEPLPPGFEAAAVEAFPDMDPASYPALKRLIATCMDAPEGSY